MVGYGWYRYNQIGRKDLALAESVGGVQNFLIVGSDSRAVIDESDPNASAYLNAPGVDGSGQRSDTIMIARVDPDAKTRRPGVVPPRPVGADHAVGGARADQHRLQRDDAEQDGAQRLIDTIKADFGIDINHYVEVDFASFKGVVDAVGGVPMYFDTAIRDRHTGFYQYRARLPDADGEQALDLSRSALPRVP